MEIDAAIKAPMEDPDWVKKCAITGLICLIPFAGVLNLLGWQREYARNRLNGRSDLPEAGLSYIGAGWAVFVSMLPLIGVIIAVSIVGAILSAILGNIAGPLALIPALATPLVSLVTGFLGPVFLYRHIVHDDSWAGARVGWAINVARENLGAVVMLWVISLVAGFIGGLGYIALLVGVFITMPLGQAIMAAGIAEFAKATNRA
jgi:hypothetical protein